MTTQLEKTFFNYILKNKKYFDIVKPYFFRNAEIQFVYNVVRDYMLKSSDGKIPSPRQMYDMVELVDKNSMISKDILKSILQTKLDQYSEKDFIIPKFNTWILSNRLKVGSVDIVDETRNLENINTFDDAVNTANKIRAIINEMASTNFIQDDNMGSDFDDPENHVQDSSKYKVKSGFDTVDHILGGGWDVSTLNCIMAMTNAGKCCSPSTLITIKDTKKNEMRMVSFKSFFTYISKGHDII
jgi:hypothetical protein